MSLVIAELQKRATEHDTSKLEDPELPMFAFYGPRLKTMNFGSEEYKECLAEMSESALDHHYANNRHHPQFFSNGVIGMNLIDLVEMAVDWMAASMRMKGGGDFTKSVEFNRKRFGINRQLSQIIQNTAEILKE